MRLWAFGVGALGLGAAIVGPPKADRWVVIVGGDTQGYLSPCGCTKPMSGGIRRRATAIRELGLAGRTLVVENGGLVEGTGRQDEMKAEAMAQFLAATGTDAVHFTSSEAKLGEGLRLSLTSLAPDRWVSADRADDEIAPSLEKGPFFVTGSAKTSAPAIPEGKTGVVLYDGGFEAARGLAGQDVGLVVYRSGGTPPPQPTTAGNTLLVTPGDKGRALVRLTFEDGRFGGYSVIDLGPQYADDAAVGRIYRTYLRRVGNERLLEALPRTPGPAYAGSAKCASCHASAAKAWRASDHAHALATLEKDGHDRDPDCVSCHVDGLASTKGFRSRTQTPNLAHVGCESCHGAGAAHAAAPKKFRFAKVGSRICTSCHTVDQSPGFDFATYWRRIAHR